MKRTIYLTAAFLTVFLASCTKNEYSAECSSCSAVTTVTIDGRPAGGWTEAVDCGTDQGKSVDRWFEGGREVVVTTKTECK